MPFTCTIPLYRNSTVREIIAKISDTVRNKLTRPFGYLMSKVKKAFQMSQSSILFTHNPITLPEPYNTCHRTPPSCLRVNFALRARQSVVATVMCRTVHVDLFKKEMLRPNMSTYTTPLKYVLFW